MIFQLYIILVYNNLKEMFTMKQTISRILKSFLPNYKKDFTEEQLEKLNIKLTKDELRLMSDYFKESSYRIGSLINR